MKTELRKLAKATLSDVVGAEVSGAAIQEQMVQSLAKFISTLHGTWGGFLPLPLEPDVNTAWARAEVGETPPRAKLVFPRIEADELIFYSKDSGVLTHPKWKVEQPLSEGAAFGPEELKGLLIPGLGFSLDGTRLGRGQGFYDRYLSKFKGQKVGVCFEVQVFAQLPSEAHDQKVDFILTEKRFVRVGEQ